MLKFYVKPVRKNLRKKAFEIISEKAENIGSVFTNHSQKRSKSCSPDFFLYLAAFECNITSDWLNCIV